MIARGDLKFNCAESTLLQINDSHLLPGFDIAAMRIASNFGGGVAGWGSVCGAVSGAMMALGLIHGTDGTETAEEFDRKRARLRGVSQDFLGMFEDEFDCIDCMCLLGVDRRTEEGKKKYEEMKQRKETRCDEYVAWASTRILDMI